MFRNNCFDLIFNSNNKSIIILNYQSNNDIENYIKSLSEFYKFDKTNMNNESLNLENSEEKNILQIIPNRNFNKNNITLLSINT